MPKGKDFYYIVTVERLLITDDGQLRIPSFKAVVSHDELEKNGDTTMRAILAEVDVGQLMGEKHGLPPGKPLDKDTAIAYLDHVYEQEDDAVSFSSRDETRRDN